MNSARPWAARAAGEAPVIGVVIPVFSHSGLVYEAITSLLDQDGAPPFVIALVNDGCLFRETDRVGALARAGGSPRLHYLYRRNGGLSAARNTGVGYLLERYPSIEGIYLLDADNRLEPYALANMARALREHPDAAWFYPDIEMFGLRVSASYAGGYSRLAHTGTNVSEAGSLIRRAVFEAGIRFDEGMRQGFEDWEFWLTAQQKGFVGRHLPGMGFRYRKRAESMLADSGRDELQLKTYIQRKHADLYRPRRLLELEAEEAPRYAIFSDDGLVRIGVDPLAPTAELTVEAFDAVFWRWMLRPDVHHSPPFLAFASRATWAVLGEAALTRWVIWDLEDRLRVAQVALSRVEHWSEAGARTAEDVRTTGEAASGAHLAMVSSDTVRAVLVDTDTCWWDGLMRGGSGIAVSRRLIQSSHAPSQSLVASAEHGLSQAVARLRGSVFREALTSEWSWTFSGQPDRHLAYRTVRQAVLGGTVYPNPPDGRLQVAFLAPYADFGGVEKVALNVAAELKAAGFAPHLFLFRTGEIHLPPPFSEMFESIGWVTSPGMLHWGGDEFLGTSLSTWARSGDMSDALGLLAGFHAVINCHSPDANGLMAHLRRRGVLTINHQHVLEYSPVGRPVGHPVLARAYEHSYNYVLTCSHQLADWFVANGLPSEKVMVIENAPSFPADPLRLEASTARRREREAAAAPLHVLFAGRFDQQKGLDRLVELVRATAGDPAFRWRVLGKSIVDKDPALQDLHRLVEIEPGVYAAEDLEEVLAWADVLVLPSRYEGVPLTILEAQRAGVVVLAANCGAIDEIIRHGIDGFIEPQDDCAAHMHARLRSLRADPALRRAVSEAAMRSGARRNWRRSTAPLVDALSRSLRPAARTSIPDAARPYDEASCKSN